MIALRHASLALATCALLLAATPALAAYHALEEIPTESPIYGQVGQLAASYGVASAFLDTQPWDRADLGRFLDQLVADHPGADKDPLVVRLRRELAPGDGMGGWDVAMAREEDETSLEFSPYVRADYDEDRARGGIARDFRGGFQASFAPDEHLLFYSDVYAGTTSPGAHGNPADSKHFGLIEGVQVNSYFDRAYLTWRGKLGRLHVGHTWLRWGPSEWGTMALSDGAPAFDVAEARMNVFRRLQMTWFIAVLDPATQHYLAGHKLELRASPALDVSLGELARFDGEASAPLFVLPVIPYSLIEKRVLKSSDLPSDSLNTLGKNNAMWDLDFNWRARPGVRLYGELAIDDISFSSEKRPRALGWNLGVEGRRLDGGRALVGTLEYARVYQYTYSSYDHLDFDFAGFPTGYPLGPDVDRVRGRLELRTGPEWTFALDGMATRKGEGQLGQFYVPGSGVVNNLTLTGVPDQDRRLAASVDYAPAPGLAIGVTGGWARVTSFDHVLGRDPSGAIGESRFTLRW